MVLNATSRAAAVGTSVNNKKFGVSAEVLTRKIVLIGTFDPLKTAVVAEEPVLLSSPEQAGDLFEFGFMLHRLAVASFEGSQGVETWAVPQDEVTGAQAAGDIDFTGSVPTENASLYLYIAGILVEVAVADTDTADNIATNVVAAVNAKIELPVTAVVNGVTTAQVDFTSKSNGPWGDMIDLSFNWGFQEELPAGVVAAITAMTGGTGTPDIQDALDALGTGDDANELGFTDLNHGYGWAHTATLDALSQWNGLGNTKTGLYKKLVHRPLRSLNGDTAAGTVGKNALIAVGTARRGTDRTNGIIASPASPNHPDEIAALAMGIMARVNSDRAEECYVGQVLPGVYPGTMADRWTKEFDDRDTAVKNGISPTRVVDGAVTMQNVMTFYHPASVPINSNGYASMRNISITQNILAAHHSNFDRDKWRGFSIVADVAKVSNALSREKARDVSAVLDDLLKLAFAYEGNAWIYTAAYTIAKLQAGGLISIRPGGLGFNTTMPVYYSGEGGILDNEVQFDIDIAALT